MTATDLTPLLRDLESDRVERKESLSEPDKIRKAICAFANDLSGHERPGVIFVGARDDGSCAGLQVTDELLQRLASMHDDGLIVPMPSMDVQRHRFDGCDVAVVTVRPAVAPPVRFRGTVYVRVGPTTRLATPADERRLAERRRSRDLPFDLHALPSATMEELDQVYFERKYLPAAVAPEVLAENDRGLAHKLKALRFLSREDEPTVMGMLVSGMDPQRYLPGAYVQFLRFEGTTLTDPVRDEKRLDGRLVDVVQRTEEVLEAHNRVAVSFTETSTEVRRWDYPPAALQQLLRNAIMHRTYEGSNTPVRVHWFDDRVEIYSPGGPYGQVNVENFGQPYVSDYRNPHVAEAMKVLGFVQKFGVGIQIARDFLAKNGNPAPVFDVDTSHVLVTLRARVIGEAAS